ASPPGAFLSCALTKTRYTSAATSSLSDHESCVSVERAASDSRHCNVCHLNWPTRIAMASWDVELRRAMRREQRSPRPGSKILVQLRMVLAELRAFLIVWRILALNRQSRPLYPPPTPFPQHISVLQRGDACLVTCLHCGFTAAGTNVRVLERLVEDHKCKP